MKRLATFLTPAEAYLLQGLLESRGVRCEVRGDSYGEAMLEPPSVWIARDEDLPLALETAAELPRRSGWAWRCGSCGESNESSFDACWSCGTPRGESSPPAG